MRVAVVATAVCLSIVGLGEAQDAKAAMRMPTHIPAQDLGPALKALAQERNLQVLYFSQTVKNLRTAGAAGELTADEALTQLLSGTGLVYKYIDDKALTILPAGMEGAAAPAKADDPDGAQVPKEGKKGSAGGFRTARVDQGGTPQPSTVGNGTANSQEGARGSQLAEIVVTAEKREERLKDVPVPVTALSADSLVNSNQLRLQDYYTQVPGLSATPGDSGRSAPFLAIRGITTGGYGNPSVATVIDDVPYGSSTSLGGGFAAPDIDPTDLARVEVLRGPQGTLYGASSLGGLIKYVTVDPSTAGVSGLVQAGTIEVRNGDGLGYSVRGAVNVPLGDTFAIRASGFTRLDPGYIDDPVLHRDGVNWGEATGGRLAALWQPSEIVSAKFSVLLQHLTQNGSSEVDLERGLGDLQQIDVPGTGGYDKNIQAYSAIFTVKFAGATLTALSGYSVFKIRDSIDFTPSLGGAAQDNFGVAGAPYFETNDTDKFTQEVRLALPVGQRLDWLIGAFYTRENSHTVQRILAADPLTGVVAGSLLYNAFPFVYEEYAGFTDLTYHFTDRFDVQVGGRESQNKQAYSQIDSGPFAGGNIPQQNTKANAFTYLVTPRFKISADLMVYARLASGYRPGGPNSNFATVGAPPSFAPDKTQNYEVGIKGDALDRALSFDVSLYHIDWKEIQLQLTTPKGGYYVNGSEAKSQGVELAVESRPREGLTIAGWVSWDDAVLTKPFPSNSQAYGVDGDRLPYSSRFSGNFSIKQEFPLVGGVKGFAAGAVSYTGDRKGVFGSPASPARQDFPAYAKTDLRAGVEYQSWTANLFVDNVTDKRGLLTGGIGTIAPNAFNYIQPRTIGLSVTKMF